jgi:hypothetical protein
MEEMGNFSVTVDPGRDYVEVELRGFLDPQTASDFNDEYRIAKARLSVDRSRHVTLIDVSGLKIQAQNIVSDFALMLRSKCSCAACSTIMPQCSTLSMRRAAGCCGLSTHRLRATSGLARASNATSANCKQSALRIDKGK